MVTTMMKLLKRFALIQSLLLLTAACESNHPMLRRKTFWTGKGFRFVNRFESTDFVRVGTSSFATLDGKYGFNVDTPRFREYAMSEDGRYLAMRGDSITAQTLAIYDMDRETLEEICVCRRTGFRSMAWTKNNELVFTHNSTNPNINELKTSDPPSVFVWSKKGVQGEYTAIRTMQGHGAS